MTFNQLAFAYPRDTWDILRLEFKMNHQVNQAEVRKQIKWLSARPHYVQKLAEQAQPYLYHIVSEIKKRHLPGELALIPMIESAYDPFAYSGAGAAGLWQLMPGTGSGLGLKQDWWFDERRDIYKSTEAALDYYEYLNNHFHGNWILTIAAYDSGEGTIGKAVKRKRQNYDRANFWSLSLPRETKDYLPRLLALAEIIRYAPQYHVKLPPTPYSPAFSKVDVGAQIDLTQAAEYADISYRELIKLNPGFNRWATPPYEPYHLNLPIEKVTLFKQRVAEIPPEELVSWAKHTVVKNESLSTIANKHHTKINLIKQLNHLNSNTVKEGQVILIPKITHIPAHYISMVKKRELLDRSTSSIHHKVVHIVQPNETIRKIQNKYRVSAAEIRYWNQIKTIRKLKPGEQLVIWKKSIPTTGYKIKKGDSLSRIAFKHHTTVRRLKQANPKLKSDTIRIGQNIKIV